ncbi:hypothetical protein [uncultured Aquincola sp.]|uniref:hypothetical protein n=1 Tax=uncultured Aquincola sp. TaxID=886556 RepID=UPI0032B2A462
MSQPTPDEAPRADASTPAEGVPQVRRPAAEVSTCWWRCSHCGTNHQLRLPRRNPGHCLNCCTPSLTPVLGFAWDR